MKRPAIVALLASALAVACRQSGGDAPVSEAQEPRPDTAPASPPTSPADAALARWAAALPDSLRHRAGACPFECCVYRTWTGSGPLPVRAAPDRREAVAFAIPAGEPFSADSGFVRVTGVSAVAVGDTVADGPTRFVPGDTLVVLDYEGEGFYNVWDGERVRQVADFWSRAVRDPKGSLVGGDHYAREWWVHATTRDARKGWIDADSVPRISGADACGE